MPDADGNVIVQTDDGKVVQYNVGDLVVDGSSESTGSAEGVNETKEPEPVGVGFFGNIYNQFKGKAKDAIDFLLRNKEGEASGALHHRDIGDISVVYGTDSYGLAHIAKKHPEVLNDLQGTIEGMAITSQSDNRIVLESPTHRAVISKMLGDKFTSDWLLTAYEKKNPASASSSDIETEPEGKQNGTATLQNEISANKVSENVVENQGNNAKTGAQPTSDPSGTSATSPKTGEEWVIPTDAKGEPMYESAPVEATIEDIYNDPDLDEEEADAFVQAKIDGATKRIAQLEKKKPKMGESKVAFKEAKAKWREQLEAEQASLAYWQGVQESVPEMRRKERAKRQMEADIAQREREQQERAEQSRRAEERGRNRGDYRKAIAGWEDTPSSFHEYVAQALLVGNYKMRWNDNGSTRGLGSHTTGRRGVNRRGEVVTARNSEARAMSWLIDDRNGLSPEALADRLWNEYTGSYGEEMSEGSPLDVLLDVVTSMPTPRAMWEYVKGEYDARMEAEQGAYEQQYSEEEIEAMERDAMYREKYGVSEDEYWAQEAQWDEFIESRYMSAEELRNYDNFVAEERIKEENERRNQENAEDEQRTDNSESERGVGLLPGEQSDNNRGNGVVTGESEGVDGNSAQSNDIAQEETAELSEEDRQAIENMPIPMLKQQIKETVVSLVNVSQLSDTWQEENKEKIERARLILAYAKQELARKEQLKKSNKWGIKVGNTATPFDVMRKMFEEFNSNEDIAQLFEKVAKVFETLPIKIVFSDTIGAKGTQGWFSPTTGTLKLPGHFVYGGRVTEQSKAETMLHEMIHAVTTYALYINEKPYLQTELGFELSDDMHAAIRQLKRIYSAIANDKDFKGEYGATSVHEMVAELSNVQFREKLKKKGLWETIVDAIKQLFGITPSNALEGAEAALEYMLNNFDRSQWDKMAGMGQKQGKQMRIGVDKMVSEDIDINPLLNVVKTLYTKGKEFASKLFSRSFFDVAKTPDFMKQLGLRGDKFTIRYGVIARHVGKDGSHDLSEKDWERLPKALQTPFAITKLNNKKDSYRIYTTLQTEKGEYIVVGVEVKNAGRDLEVNAVSTAFGRRTDANLPTNEDVIYTDTNITPDQSSLLERPNFAQYPTDQELSTDKVSDNIGDVQGLEDYSAEEIKEIAREYIEDVIAESGFDAEVVDLAIYGSRRRGDAREDSDLDIVVEYSGNAREDDLFNALNDAETQLEIDGVKVDINPITKSKSGTLGEFMERAREYDEGNESNGSTKDSQPLTNPFAFGTSPKTGEESEGSLEDDGLLFRDGDVTTSPLASGGELGTTAEAYTVGYSDAEVSMANDPIAKIMGKSQRSKKQQAKFAERERKYMRNRVAELAEKMHLDNVEVVDNSQSTPSPQGGTPPKQGSGGELDNPNKTSKTTMSERKARAKGWYDTKSGKIVISLSNHTSVADLERTLLHEAVAHHGLRGLFGKQFDTFLDNVFRNAEADIRAQIVDLAKRNGWDFRVATEEYLASLAENTNFEALENNWGWWQKIKQLFMDMLESIGWDYKGPELSDNELRYLLWRSYENMVNPGRHRSILGMAEDIAKQNELKVGNYSAEVASTSQVAEPKLTIGGIDLGNVKATNNGRKLIATTRKGHSQVFKSVYKYATEKFGAENVEYEKAKSGSIYMTVDLPNGHNVEIRFASHTPSGYSYGEIELESETKGFKWSAINGRVSANVDISFNTMTSGDLQAFLDLMNEYAENGFPQEIINELQSYRARSKEVSEALGISVDTLSEEGEVYSDGATIEAVNEQFNNELQQQIDGTLPKGHIYQLGMPSEVLLSTGIANAPIQLNSQKLLDKSSNFGHDYELSEIKDLVKAINNPIAIFAYGDKGKAQNIVVEIQHEGKNFIVGLSIRPIVGGRVLEVNSIRNVFPKDNAEWLNWIAQGKALFLNKEKIQTLIDQQRTNLADVEYLDLDSIANIIETFENPTISSEENNESSNAERDGDEGILFRNGESDGTREAYNKRVRRPNKRGDVGKWGNLSFRIREAYQDSMLSLDALQKVVMEKYGLTEIPSWMNAYMQENLMSSRNKAASDVYMRDFYNPMMKEVQALIKKGVKYEDLVNYMIAKHGLERNVVMAEREAERVANDVLPEKYQGKPLEELDLKLQNKWKEKYQEALAETRNKDYSGLTALTEEEDVATAEGKAQLMVDAFEKKEDYAKDDKVNKLWEKVNKATKATLQKTYEGGIIDADTYRQTAEMYEYYIPLRGWDTDIASDVYTYLTSSRPMLSPAMKIAHGRSSLADDPIATIGLMAESTIAQANRNAMKRAFYFFALNNPSDLVTIGKQWYIKNEVTFLPKTCPCFHFLIIDYIKITTNSHLQAKNSLLYHKVTKILTIFAVDFAIFHANITILN